MAKLYLVFIENNMLGIFAHYKATTIVFVVFAFLFFYFYFFQRVEIENIDTLDFVFNIVKNE